MKKKINFWCLLGIHNWYYGYWPAPAWGHRRRECLDCRKAQYRVIDNGQWITFK